MKKYNSLLFICLILTAMLLISSCSSKGKTNSELNNEKQNEEENEEMVDHDSHKDTNLNEDVGIDEEAERIDDTEADESEPKELSEEKLQGTASKVQEYVANLVNDLTIIENMSSNLQTLSANLSIYPEETFRGEVSIDEEIESKTDLMIEASDDIKDLKPPHQTDYAIFDPQFKQFAEQYKSIAQKFQEEFRNNNGDIKWELSDQLKELDSDINELHNSLGITIGQNNYLEYNALILVWEQGKLYYSNDSSEAIIARGIYMGLLDVGLDFRQDIQ